MMSTASIRLVTCAAAFACYGISYSQDATLASVTKYASFYSDAVLKKNFSAMVASMYPALRTHLGGHEKASAFYRDAPPSIWPVAEKLGEPELCSVGGLEVALVKTTRTLKFLQGPFETEHTYVFVSSDKGKNWGVVDQGCTSAKTISMISPELINSRCGKKLLERFFPE